MKTKSNIISKLSPILGAGAIGVCPLCWVGSASLLTYLGLGSLISKWIWISGALLGVGLVGFALDFRFHKNIIPMVGLLSGAALLYVGRYYSFTPGTLGNWYVWTLGAVIVVGSIIYNKKLFAKGKNNGSKSLAKTTAKESVKTDIQTNSTIKCPKCGFEKKEKMSSDSCQYFYKCTGCESNLKPKEGDCCVFCSYADNKCPPKQQE